MPETFDPVAIDHAATALRAGGVVAYPTEAVYGLGCDPRNHAAFERLFALKQRPPTQGVLLIGASFDQLAPWIDLDAVPAPALQRVRDSWPGPYTWILPRAATVPDWVAGAHPGIALRLTAHAPAAALCRAFNGAIVSTSANVHGQPPTRDAVAVRAAFGEAVDAVVDAATGGQQAPTVIRNALTGAIIRG